MGVSITMAGAPPFPALLVAATALLLLCSTAPPADALCDKGDKAVLLALKASLGNPADLASWNESTDCCDTWGSMECGNGGRVTVVDIQSTNASGSIPASIANLTYLERLVIRRCPNLTGPIPYNINKLSNLWELNLEKNNLTGGIPATIGWLTTLTSLSLSQNHLTGSLPYSIGRLHRLVDFYVDSNELYGWIPASADKMKHLRQFDVSHNYLCGKIPQGGVINKFPAASFADNLCLCGHPLPPCARQAKHGLADQSYPVEATR